MFWREIVYKDGKLDEEAVLNELADYHFLLRRRRGEMRKREVYYELRCLDCGNDGSEVDQTSLLLGKKNRGFRVTVTAHEDYLIDGTGYFCAGGDYWGVRYDWRLLRCAACCSKNVQRKRRYRMAEATPHA